MKLFYSSHNKSLQQLIIFAVVTALLAMLLVVIAPASPARAAGCGGVDSFGCSSGNNNGGSNGTQPGSGAGNPPSSGGGGGGGGGAGQGDPFLRIDRIVPDQGMCPYRASDKKSALGVDIYWTTIFAYGGKDTQPNNQYYWKNPVYTPGYGYLWETEVLLKSVCLYPPKTYLTDQLCYISSTSTVTMEQPVVKTMGSKTEYSGFTQGSTDYEACRSSSSEVNIGLPLREIGFYSSHAYSLAQIATVEVAYTADDVTGVIPPPKIIGLSGVFQTAPADATLSIPCTGVGEQPGVRRAVWSETACTSQNSNTPTVMCSTNSATVNGFPNYAEAMGNGEDVKLQFNQQITGDGLTVTKNSARYYRSPDSLPWNPKDKASYNLVELDVVRSDGSIAKNALTDASNGKSTAQYSGKLDRAILRGFDKSNLVDIAGKNAVMGSTKITQELHFEGTIWKNSLVIQTIKIAERKVVTTPSRELMPTKGECLQTATTQFLRAQLAG